MRTAIFSPFVNICSSWQFNDATGQCLLNTDVPLTHHTTTPTTHCGLRTVNGWTTDGASMSLMQHPLGKGPSEGGVTLRPVVDTDADTTASFGASNDPAELYGLFARQGHFNNTVLGSGGNGNGVALNSSGSVKAHGASSVSTTVPAGGRRVLSIVFAWHFPDRDWEGIIMGNRYTDLWEDSHAVAAHLADGEVLRGKVRPIGVTNPPCTTHILTVLPLRCRHSYMVSFIMFINE